MSTSPAEWVTAQRLIPLHIPMLGRRSFLATRNVRLRTSPHRLGAARSPTVVIRPPYANTDALDALRVEALGGLTIGDG
jgi:hypothetical protein